MEYAFGHHEYNDSTRCELDELWEDINNSDDTLWQEHHIIANPYKKGYWPGIYNHNED